MRADYLKQILANLGGTGLTLTHNSTNGIVLNHDNYVTAGTAGTSSATSGATLAVPYVTYNAQGHITAAGTHTHTITGFLTSSSSLDASKLTGTIPSSVIPASIDEILEYDAKANKLIKKADGDKRELMASNGGNAGFKQDFVLNAPVSLLMVIDYDKFGSSDEKATMMCCVDAGNVSENINLYCQAVGLATVPRATHDTNSIKALLGLTDKQLPIMNNPVGYAK